LVGLNDKNLVSRVDGGEREGDPGRRGLGAV